MVASVGFAGLALLFDAAAPSTTAGAASPATGAGGSGAFGAADSTTIGLCTLAALAAGSLAGLSAAGLTSGTGSARATTGASGLASGALTSAVTDDTPVGVPFTDVGFLSSTCAGRQSMSDHVRFIRPDNTLTAGCVVGMLVSDLASAGCEPLATEAAFCPFSTLPDCSLAGCG